jgi:hypothetical protein
VGKLAMDDLALVKLHLGNFYFNNQLDVDQPSMRASWKSISRQSIDNLKQWSQKFVSFTYLASIVAMHKM